MSTKQLSDVRVPGSTYAISLTSLTGKKIKDIRGMLSGEFGDATFLLLEVEFEGGSQCGVEGEHDHPYLVEYPSSIIDGLDQETLNRLYKEENGDDDANQTESD